MPRNAKHYATNKRCHTHTCMHTIPSDCTPSMECTHAHVHVHVHVGTNIHIKAGACKYIVHVLHICHGRSPSIIYVHTYMYSSSDPLKNKLIRMRNENHYENTAWLKSSCLPGRLHRSVFGKVNEKPESSCRRTCN